MRRPRAVILGGKSPLRAARELGAECLYVERPGRMSPAKIALADSALMMDYTDTGLLCGLVGAWHAASPLDAVLSMTEPGLLPAAVLADSLGLGGPSVQAVTLLRDKAAMRRRLAQPGGETPVVPAITGTHAVDITQFGRRHGYPCIVKPPSGTASAGINLVRSDAEADAAVRRLAAIGARPFLVESYLAGREFSVETLSFGGEHVVVAITEKFVGPSFVEVGHLVPARIGPAEAAALGRAARSLLETVGLRDGAAHTEICLTPEGARVIESHSRVGGDRINELVRIAFGVDMIAAAVAWALYQERSPIPAAPRAAACIRYLTPLPGLVTDVTGVEEVRRHRAVAELEVTASAGDVLRPVEQSGDRCGHVLVRARTAEEALAMAGELAARVTVTTLRPEPRRSHRYVS